MLDLTELIKHFEQYEGRAPCFYLDGDSNVTIGIGCVVSDYSSLRLYNKKTHLTAPQFDIRNEFNLISRAQAGNKLDYYNSLCLLYMADPDIDALFNARVDKFIEGITNKIIRFNTLPKQAQLVLLDMTFNLGVDGLINKFPQFCFALQNKLWLAAAKESHRLGIQDSRNEWAFSILMELTK